VFESIFETVNSGFAQALYEEFLADPAAVPPEWRRLFESGVKGEAPAAAPKPAAAGTSQAAPKEVPAPANSLEPIKGPALRLLQNMEASLELPTATSFRDIDVTSLWSARSDLNRQLASRGVKLSFTHVIGWAIVRACGQYPSMFGAVVEIDGEPHRAHPAGVRLGLAVDVQRKDGSRGLMVPVIKGADGLSFAEYHVEYERLVAGARQGKLLPDAYAGATITLTNPGTIGTVASVPRLMQGQGSIIATGAIRDMAGRRLMTITSTYDHRIIQGAESGLFLQYVDQVLQGGHQFYREIAAEMGVEEPVAVPSGVAAEHLPVAAAAPATDFMYHIAAAMSLVRAHRTHGYLAAHLDPLGTPPRDDPALHPENVDLTPDIMRAIPATVLRTYVGGETLDDVLPRLRETYCGTIAYELEHIANHGERVWLRRVIESGEHRTPLSDDEKRHLLSELTRVDVLARFLHKNYLGHKRFGIEGLDMLVPMLHRAMDLAAEDGVREVVMGMAHRGRLNVLTHIMGRPYETLLAEFEGGREVEETLTPKGGTGDVKYHHGATGSYTTAHGHDVHITLMPNPSHLEAVDPGVEGTARAKQTDRSGATALHHPTTVLPILMHGDAAFAAQGVVAETFNLSKLAGYGTGGTLHIITNNQIGFTTDAKDARSTDFASDLAKGFDVPIVHVNADDPEACLAAVRLGIMYRTKCLGDFVINLVGYRRHGHNEGDEPRYTQPLMYQRIDAHPIVRDLYAARLVKLGVVDAAAAAAEADQLYQELTDTQDRLRHDLEDQDEGQEPDRVSGMFMAMVEPRTAVGGTDLLELNRELYTTPDGFEVNRKLWKQFKQRARAVEDGGELDWAHAEALALASLRLDGVPIRFTGQDVERGTFSQRHLVLHDAENGRSYAPILNLSRARAPLELHNSPLSEYAALGFEYGYAAAVPQVLVLWEAQFGDFVNGAEIIIDQFLIAGLAKWGQTSRLTLLLPHGYEGQGPEHSSARVERFMALTAAGNIRVANCSTPAQYFHLLRRQGLHGETRPLVVFTPKSLLRHPRAVSPVRDLTDGEFAALLGDQSFTGAEADVTRLVLCTGKIYYDAITAEPRAQAGHVAFGRIEMLYPFPHHELEDFVARYPNLREIVWLQEEPENMGARKWAVPHLMVAAPPGVDVRYVSRPERSSPAEGYPAAHKAEQERLIREVLAAS